MADYGLNAVADAMGKDYYGAGQRQYGDLQSTLANTEATRANTARTEALTPLEAERARLDNLQQQADEQAGVYGAKSEENLWTAKQKARQAQQGWEQLPEEHKIKMIQQTKEKTAAVIKGALSQVMATGDPQAAVRFIEQNLPEATRDKGWAQAVQQYNTMTADQVIAKMNETLSRLGSSDVMASPEQQGKMISEDQRHQNVMELGRLQGQTQERVAGMRPAGTDNLTQPELVERYLNIYQDESQPPAVREKARQALEYLSKAGTQTKDTLLGPQTTTKESLLPSALPKKTITIPKEALTYLLNNPETASDFEAHYKIQPGWAEQYIRENKKGK